MAKWFVTITVAVLCFFGVLAQNDHSNVTFSEELSFENVSSQPTISSIKMQTTSTNDGKAVGNIDDGSTIKYKISSTFPPLIHNTNPEDDPPITEATSVTDEPQKIHFSNVESEFSTEKMKATKVPVVDVETAKTSAKSPISKSNNNANAEKTNNNSQNIIQSNSIILLFCILLSKFSY